MICPDFCLSDQLGTTCYQPTLTQINLGTTGSCGSSRRRFIRDGRSEGGTEDGRHSCGRAQTVADGWWLCIANGLEIRIANGKKNSQKKSISAALCEVHSF